MSFLFCSSKIICTFAHIIIYTMAKKKKIVTVFQDTIDKGNKICNKIDRNFSQMTEMAIDRWYNDIFSGKD